MGLKRNSKCRYVSYNLFFNVALMYRNPCFVAFYTLRSHHSHKCCKNVFGNQEGCDCYDGNMTVNIIVTTPNFSSPSNHTSLG